MCGLSRETIDRILKQGQIYEVGGAVRDRYLGHTPVKDRDYLVTGIPYDKLTALLRTTGRVDLVGRSFGVIKFTQSFGGTARTFDIALPRKEHSTGAGHKDFFVDFDPSLSVEDDLARRDFTVNAMAVALDSDEIIDPLNGMADLENKCLRMTSPASFVEDPLRMMRAIQFAARFDFTIEPDTLESLRLNVEKIKTVSPERISEELNKLLVQAKKPSGGFRLMQETGLLKQILPELEECVGVDQPGGYHKYNVFEHTLHCLDACPQKLNIRLAALFHDINKPQSKRITETGASFYGHESLGARTARRVMKRLRYSNDLIEDVVILVDRHMFTTGVTDKGMRRLIRRVGQERIFDLLDLRRADVVGQGMGGTTEDVDEFEQAIRDEIDRKPPFGLSDLAINGRDIMEMFDLQESPVIGKILNHLMEQVLDDPQSNTREILSESARSFYQSFVKTNDRESDKEPN